MANEQMNALEEEIPEIHQSYQNVRCWWEADLDYLPIHYFQKQMKAYCIELHHKPEMKRILEICDEITDFITVDMRKEISIEYDYYYGKGVMDMKNQSLVQCGYIELLKHVVTKLIRIYLETDQKEVYSHLCRFYKSWFEKERWWDDYELDRIEELIHKLTTKKMGEL